MNATDLLETQHRDKAVDSQQMAREPRGTVPADTVAAATICTI